MLRPDNEYQYYLDCSVCTEYLVIYENFMSNRTFLNKTWISIPKKDFWKVIGK